MNVAALFLWGVTAILGLVGLGCVGSFFYFAFRNSVRGSRQYADDLSVMSTCAMCAVMFWSIAAGVAYLAQHI